MNEIDDSYHFRSGRTLEPSQGLISIRQDDRGEWRLYEGYDAELSMTCWDPQSRQRVEFTPEEKAELADFMIARWQAFKSSITTAVRTEPV